MGKRQGASPKLVLAVLALLGGQLAGPPTLPYPGLRGTETPAAAPTAATPPRTAAAEAAAGRTGAAAVDGETGEPRSGGDASGK